MVQKMSSKKSQPWVVRRRQPNAMRYLQYTFLALIFAVAAYGIQSQLTIRIPDAGLTTHQQIQKYGYPFENHEITTEDGYVLTAQRIPYGRHNTPSKGRAVLLMPGILRSSEIWTSFGPEKSLGFILADSGYDVWLGNHRGTTWSRKHRQLDADLNAKQYWNFSMDELGVYDCPAFIDYILETTGQTSIIYIGDTMGATMFFIMAAEKPTYNDKVKLAVAIAPMVYLKNAKSLLYSTVANFKHEIQALSEFFGIYDTLRHGTWLTSLGLSICDKLIFRDICAFVHFIGVGFNYPQYNKALSEFFGIYDTLRHGTWLTSLGLSICDKLIFRDICAFVHFIGVGFNYPQYNKTATPLLLNGFPAGSSVKELLHISQIYETDSFAKYDYGSVINLQKYGQKTSPVYDLSKVSTPISLYYGENDVLVNKLDVERVIPSLRSLVSKTFVKEFNNADFLWAIDVVNLIYKDLIKLVDNY